MVKKDTVAGVPASLHGRQEAIVIFNNLPDILAGGASVLREESPLEKEARAGLALRIDQTMREKAPAGWKGDDKAISMTTHDATAAPLVFHLHLAPSNFATAVHSMYLLATRF